MSFLSYIFPRELYRGSSKFSSDIRVIEDSGSLRLLVNGIEQSGKYIDTILKRAYDSCGFPSHKIINNMLLLGLGGGSLIRFFRHRFPDIAVDVVDVDPVIIHVAKTYFGFKNQSWLNIYEADARTFVDGQAKKTKMRYGLIIVDVYVGRVIPDFVWQQPFFEQIRTLLVPRGLVFINVVHDGVSAERVKTLRTILRSLFRKTQEIPVDYNTFFLATA